MPPVCNAATPLPPTLLSSFPLWRQTPFHRSEPNAASRDPQYESTTQGTGFQASQAPQVNAANVRQTDHETGQEIGCKTKYARQQDPKDGQEAQGGRLPKMLLIEAGFEAAKEEWG